MGPQSAAHSSVSKKTKLGGPVLAALPNPAHARSARRARRSVVLAFFGQAMVGRLEKAPSKAPLVAARSNASAHRLETKPESRSGESECYLLLCPDGVGVSRHM